MANRIILHHQEGVEDTVDRIDLLTDLLIAERKNILIVGEVNFTLTVAFASLRKYQYKKPVTEQLRQFQIERVSEHDWEGITSSRYEPAGDELKMESVGSERVYCKPPPRAITGQCRKM